ncbi:hypothetical protein RAD16_25710 [Bradyrhizobium sp. 18BD]
MRINFRELIGPDADGSRVLSIEALGDTPERATAWVADTLDQWLRDTPFSRRKVILSEADELPPQMVHAGRGAASVLAGLAALPLMAVISLALSYRPVRTRLAVLASPMVGAVLLIFVVTDLALGGNGYLAKLGSFRLRDLLFVLCMLWAVASVVARPECRPPRAIWWLFAMFFGVTSFGFVYGYLAGNFDTGYVLSSGSDMVADASPAAAVMLELKPLLYFPMLLFFVVAIRSRIDVTTVVSILVASGVLLAACYLLLLLSASLGLVSYAGIHDALFVSDEFIFRQTVDKHAPFVGFFYKGMFYVCIAAVLLSLDPFKMTKIAGAIAAAAVALTLTRSLTFALAACLVVGFVMTRDRRALQLAGQLAVLIAVMLFAHQADTNLRAEFERSSVEHPRNKPPAGESIVKNFERPTDSYRSGDIRFVADRLDFRTLLIGRGFGAKIDQRSRIELNYLEVFYKQGLLGLATWFILFGAICWLYRRIPACNKTLALALLLASLFVFVSTAATTFLTGSIGMGMAFIAISSLSVLSRETKPVAWYPNWAARRVANA